MVKYEIPRPYAVKEEKKALPVKIEEPEKLQTVEDSQIEYTEKQEKRFFQEDDEIVEVDWD